MDSDNQNDLYWANDDQNRIYCDVCDKVAEDKNCDNHLNHKVISIIFVKDNK